MFTLHAQKSFYIKPRVMMKTNCSYINSHELLNLENPLNNAINEFYSFYNYGNHFSNSSVNLGLSLGYKLSKKNALELYVSADNTSIKSAFVYNSPDQTLLNQGVVSYHPSYSSSLTSPGLIRFGIEYHRTLISKSFFDVRGMAGIGFFVSKNFNNVSTSGGWTLPNYTANIQETNIGYKRISPVFQFGTGLDFKTKKGMPFCSLDLFLSYNPGKSLYSTSYDVSVVENSGQTTHFNHSLNSKGSGINFQLSVPIQVYPWRPNKKD